MDTYTNQKESDHERGIFMDVKKDYKRNSAYISITDLLIFSTLHPQGLGEVPPPEERPPPSPVPAPAPRVGRPKKNKPKTLIDPDQRVSVGLCVFVCMCVCKKDDY